MSKNLIEEAERCADEADGLLCARLLRKLAAALRDAGEQLKQREEHLRVIMLERDHAQQVEVPDALRRMQEAEQERDAAQKSAAEWEIQAADFRDRLVRAEADLAAARETITRLNRRAQLAEAGVRDNVEACKAAGVSLGRALANAAADQYLRRAEQAEAERDAQHEQVLRLTAERDRAYALSEQATELSTRDAKRLHAELLEKIEGLTAERDKARGQVWGLICAATNALDVVEDQVKRTRELSRLLREQDPVCTDGGGE